MKVDRHNSLPSLEGGPERLPQVAAASLMDLCGSLSDEDAEEMIRLIEEEFEQTDDE